LHWALQALPESEDVRRAGKQEGKIDFRNQKIARLLDQEESGILLLHL
jgi:hypothetical protein